MSELPTVEDTSQFHRIVVGALRTTINAHGPITEQFIGSAAKRITHAVLAAQQERGDIRHAYGRVEDSVDFLACLHEQVVAEMERLQRAVSNQREAREGR